MTASRLRLVSEREARAQFGHTIFVEMRGSWHRRNMIRRACQWYLCYLVVCLRILALALELCGCILFHLLGRLLLIAGRYRGLGG
jgi:hypothetical protein